MSDPKEYADLVSEMNPDAPKLVQIRENGNILFSNGIVLKPVSGDRYSILHPATGTVYSATHGWVRNWRDSSDQTESWQPLEVTIDLLPSLNPGESKPLQQDWFDRP